MSRLDEAIDLVIDRMPDDMKRLVNLILDLDQEISIMDWNDWTDWYEDNTENGLKAYLIEIFDLRRN